MPTTVDCRQSNPPSCLPCATAMPRPRSTGSARRSGFERHAVYANPDGSHRSRRTHPRRRHDHARLGEGRRVSAADFKSPGDSATETRSAYIVVPDADAVYARAQAAGATVVRDPAEHRLRQPRIHRERSGRPLAGASGHTIRGRRRVQRTVWERCSIEIEDLARVHAVVGVERALEAAHHVRAPRRVRHADTSSCRSPRHARRCRCRPWLARAPPAGRRRLRPPQPAPGA